MLKVLLIDDEDLETYGLVAMINTFDLPLTVCAIARNGKDGLQKALETQPHIVVTDLRMPQMDGIELIRALRSLPEESISPQLQAVLISGYEDFHAARAGLELGIAAYLLKPINRNELYRILVKCCTAWKTAEPLAQPKEGPLYTAEEEVRSRTLLDGSLESEASNGDMKKACAVIAARVTFAGGESMTSHATALQAIAKRRNAPAPIVMDDALAVMIIDAPAFLSDGDFLDLLEKTTDELLLLLNSLGGADHIIGVSDLGRGYGDLPRLYKQSLTALRRRAPHTLAQIVFYEERRAASRRSADDKLIARIQRIIHSEYATALSIDSIAERLYLSPSHVRRFFKNKTGQAMMSYVESVRMDRAKALLAQPQYKIHEIGELVGYENPSYFNLVFKKYFGKTPGEYRRSLE